MTRRADRFFIQQQLWEMNFDEPTFAQRPTLLGAQLESPEREQFDSAREDVGNEEGGLTSGLDADLGTSTGEETEPLGTQAGRPLLTGTAKGTEPCEESVPGYDEISEALRISALVSHCFEKPPKKMPSPTGTGIVRLRMLWREAMMLPRLKTLCLRPWRGWPETMPK